ncbi:MAG: UDP-4-amino-4,6-dideoxy-N-acetyl-beta-L-altrosamine transaminase [Armatimonadetes bacterium CG2_30_59_28]|nr:MAG: UDP-4-amino-4,6-dideoxy-N-acetyl-beta-L-altrosamine transaminase [Armatimonadetes bacterium CG2_30_59_28]
MHDTFIPFSPPSLGEDEIAEVVDALRSGWLTTGPKVKRFEQEFAEYVGAAHAVAVNSGTAALHIALAAIGIKPGDKVLVPTMTFAATAEVVCYFGADPVLVDCDPGTLNITPGTVDAALTRLASVERKKVRAVIPVHIAGQPCEMCELLQLAATEQLEVVEDAAHALPAMDGGQMIGAISRATAFSFYATKTITTGEGGMLTTNDGDLADHCRRLSLHGISKDAWKRYTSEGSWYYEILEPGYKYNMTDIAASIGIHQLHKCDRFWERRREIAEKYDRAFASLPELEIPSVSPTVQQHAWHLYILRLNLDRLQCDRAQFIEELRSRGIGTSVHFIPLHLHPYYRETYGYQPEDFPVAYSQYQRSLSLPIYPALTDNDVDRVIASVVEILDKFRR